jgi:hypothetical protein
MDLNNYTESALTTYRPSTVHAALRLVLLSEKVDSQTVWHYLLKRYHVGHRYGTTATLWAIAIIRRKS